MVRARRTRGTLVRCLLAVAALALPACGGGPDATAQSEATEDAVQPGERERSRRDLLGSAIARGPAWSPGRPLYTAEQAIRGEDLFLLYCTACHGLEAMTSDKLRDNWTGRTVGDFYEYVRYAMPYDVPGRLSADQNADLLAFILRENGLPAGAEPFPTDMEVLQQLRLMHPDSIGAATAP